MDSIVRVAHVSSHGVLFMQHWSKVEHPVGELHPVGRSSHAAVCLGYGGDHPQLLVIGGRGAGYKVLGDAWLLDVQSGQWREVRISTCITSIEICSLCRSGYQRNSGGDFLTVLLPSASVLD